MQILIDIPEEIKVEISRMGLLRMPDEKIKAVDMAIQKGTPIPNDCEILAKEAYSDLCMRAGGR